jgi:hypothetical protein
VDNLLGWGTFAAITCAVIGMLGAQVLGWFGLRLVGAP